MAAAPVMPAAGGEEMTLGSLMNDVATEIDAGGDEGGEPEAVETAGEDIPGGEEPTAPETEGEAPVGTPPGEAPTSEFKLTEDGKFHLVPKGQLPQLQGFKQFATEVQEIFPTANDAKFAAQQATDARAMHADFIHGDERAMEAFLRHFAGEDATDPVLQSQFKAAFSRMAVKAPQILKDIDPNGYNQFMEGVGSQKIEAAYQHAKEWADYARTSGLPGAQEEAALWLRRAQYLEWGETGQVKRGEHNPTTGDYKYQFEEENPQVAEAARIAKERDDLQTQRQQMLDRDFKSFDDANVNAPAWQEYWKYFDETLAPVKAAFDKIGKPLQYKAIKEQINKDFIAKLKADYDWVRNHNNEFNAIKDTYKHFWNKGEDARPNLKPRIDAYKNDLMAWTRRYLPSIAQPYINEATAAAVAQNRTARTTRAPQTRPTPTVTANPAGTPAQQRIQGKVKMTEDPEFLQFFKQ